MRPTSGWSSLSGFLWHGWNCACACTLSAGHVSAQSVGGGCCWLHSFSAADAAGRCGLALTFWFCACSLVGHSLKDPDADVAKALQTVRKRVSVWGPALKEVQTTSGTRCKIVCDNVGEVVMTFAPFVSTLCGH